MLGDDISVHAQKGMKNSTSVLMRHKYVRHELISPLQSVSWSSCNCCFYGWSYSFSFFFCNEVIIETNESMLYKFKMQRCCLKLSHTLVKHQSWLKLCNRLIFIGHALLHLLCCLVHCFPATLAADLADLSTVFLLVSKLFPSCFFNLSFSAVAMNTILRIWLHPCPWNWPKNINDENKQLGTDESTNLL